MLLVLENIREMAQVFAMGLAAFAIGCLSVFNGDALVWGKAIGDVLDKAKTRKSYIRHRRINLFAYSIVFMGSACLPSDIALLVFVPGFLAVLVSESVCNWRNLGCILPLEL